MSNETVRAAYSALSARYISLFGAIDRVNADDLRLLDDYLEPTVGPVIDAGCGPGHLTAHLASRGVDARGIDLVPEFLDHARSSYPRVRFAQGSLLALPTADDSLGGILAWYSLIHLNPHEVPAALAEFHRALSRYGVLVLGFFDGKAVERFDHKVVSAHYWPVSVMVDLVHECGFVVAETQTRIEPGVRSQAALVARKP